MTNVPLTTTRDALVYELVSLAAVVAFAATIRQIAYFLVIRKRP